ncbi:MAG: NAD-glutamate dehydrogenase domain-containing protein [Gemmatimonadota bacterium]
MSDTTEQGARRLREGSPDLKAICTRVESLLEPQEVPHALRLAELFFSKAPRDYLGHRSSDAQAHVLAGVYRFLAQPMGDLPKVQVFVPDVDNEGWHGPVTVIRTNVSERPFVVDSIREFLASQDLAIGNMVYPVLLVDRDEEGRIVALGPSESAGRRESLVHCEVVGEQDPDSIRFLQEELQRRLVDVVRATDDFPKMVKALDRTVTSLAEQSQNLPQRKAEFEEIQAFLRWLRDGAFVFLGYRGYDLVGGPGSEDRLAKVEEGSGLGILRDESESRFAEGVKIASLPGDLRRLMDQGPTLIISKTNASSTVHRRVRMDYIGVKKLDDMGRIVGERRFMGLFTSRAYNERAEQVPILREKLTRVLEEAGVRVGSHDYKEIHTIFNSFPTEDLFLASVEEITKDVQAVLTMYHSHGARVTLRRDPLNRGTSVMVILAKERFSGEVRKSIEELLIDHFQGEVLNYHLALGEGEQARLHFYLSAPPERLETVEAVDLERAIGEIIRSWEDRVREGLERFRPSEEARRLAGVYGEAVSPEYRAATDPLVAVEDVLELEAMESTGRDVAIALANRDAKTFSDGEELSELRLFLRGERLILSEFMPILEDAGLRVIAVTPFQIQGRGVPGASIYSFHVQDPAGGLLDVNGGGRLLSELILAVRRGDASSDSLNSLVVLAGLAWREIEVLRAYASYAFQVGAVPSRVSLPVALVKHPDVARILLHRFEVRFGLDEGSPDERATRLGEIQAQFLESLNKVTVLGDDRALRRLALLIDGTVRTNYFRNGGRDPSRTSGGVPYISFKVATRGLEGVPRTRVLYEVWVRSPRMEGVHLRGARVARGGIRYSDRPDDFRTEVLGLVKTQMVKNAVIVPAGSKGGFVTLRQLPPEAMADEAREQYCTLIRGLLDLTDNLVEGRHVPPEGVFCHDRADPYLVVAADKGTAKYSDVANGVAEEYGFWLGDAFASGGSNGYDHKEVGITAGGAWECVRRHFLERGKDIQSEPFTVVGIGDMSGDVFGNGMLLSRQIRLLAAFDHRHVFLDPNPDPERSYQERERMFALGPSSWEDYGRDVLSEGGMIISRGAKKVELTPQAREILGLPDDAEPLDGEGLVRTVLKAPVELLWNGGIGTYVRSSDEHNAEVGDASNDAVRINALELRAKVVGEGGNLGFTQKARVEAALNGVLLNTDAIDNSGGVDLSDREVNLKILLNGAVQQGILPVEDRNPLLTELQSSVAQQVLEDNRSQSRAISLDLARSAEGLDDFRDLISALEKEGFLDRADESLPTWEAIQERVEAGMGLTRPELCILLAYAKLHLMSSLLRGKLLDEELTESYLLGYFPGPAVARAGGAARHHRLRREIIASQLTSELVDLMGATFIHRVARDTGRTSHEVAQAWLVAARLAGHRALLDRLKGSETSIPLEVVYRWYLGLARVLDRTARWVLANSDMEQSPEATIKASVDGLARLRERFPEIVTGEDRELFHELVDELESAGVDSEFARNLITLRFLDQLLEILRVVRDSGADPVDAARVFYQVSDLTQVPWTRQAIFAAAADDRWEQRAAQVLADDLTWAHQRVAAWVMGQQETLGSLEAAMDELTRRRSRELQRLLDLLDEVRGQEKISLMALSVVVRELIFLAERLDRPATAKAPVSD